MGAGRILSEAGEGLYQVKLVFGDQLDTQLTTLTTKRAALEKELLQLRAKQIDLNDVSAEAYNDLLNKITSWQNNIELPEESLTKPAAWSAKSFQYVIRTASKIDLPNTLVASFTRLSTASQNQAAGERNIANKQAEYLALLAKQSELTTLKKTEVEGIPVWCADYTENLTGTVDIAILEVFGEYAPPIGGGVNIKPGFSSATWTPQYGKLQRSVTLSESGFAWNMTMLNPWEKWMPTWRYATVVNVKSMTLDLELQPVASVLRSYLGKINTLNDPLTSSMTDVEVAYMHCNKAVFDIGDEVIVEFNLTISGSLEYYTPRVIGFKDHPKRCSQFFFVPGPYLIARGRADLVPIIEAGNFSCEGDYGIVSCSGNNIFFDGKLLTTVNFAIYRPGSGIFGATLTKYDNIKFINFIRVSYNPQYGNNPYFGYIATACQFSINNIVNKVVQAVELNSQVVSFVRIDDYPQVLEWKFSENGNYAACVYYYNNSLVGGSPYPNYNIFECIFFYNSASFVNHGAQPIPNNPPGTVAYDHNMAVDYKNNNRVIARQTRYGYGTGDLSGDYIDTFKVYINDQAIITVTKSGFQEQTSYTYKIDQQQDEDYEILGINLKNNVIFYHKYLKTIEGEFAGNISSFGIIDVDYSVTETARHQFIVFNDGVETILKDTDIISATQSGSYKIVISGPYASLGDVEMHTATRSANLTGFNCLSNRNEIMLYHYAGFTVNDPINIHPHSFKAAYEDALQPNFYIRWYSEADITDPLPFMPFLIERPIKLI